MNIGNLYDYMEHAKGLNAFEQYDLWSIGYSARRGQKCETKSQAIANACKKCGCRVIRKDDVWKIS